MVRAKDVTQNHCDDNSSFNELMPDLFVCVWQIMNSENKVHNGLFL